MTYEITTSGPTETIALGRRIGTCLQGGEVFAINGPLGAGKTHLIKGIAQGLGAEDMGQVTSPTFVLVNEYEGRLLLYHLDAYRLDNEDQLEMLGFDDYLGPDTVVLVEWAERVSGVLRGLECIDVVIEHVDAEHRKIAINHIPAHLEKGMENGI